MCCRDVEHHDGIQDKNNNTNTNYYDDDDDDDDDKCCKQERRRQQPRLCGSRNSGNPDGTSRRPPVVRIAPLDPAVQPCSREHSLLSQSCWTHDSIPNLQSGPSSGSGRHGLCLANLWNELLLPFAVHGRAAVLPLPVQSGNHRSIVSFSGCPVAGVVVDAIANGIDAKIQIQGTQRKQKSPSSGFGGSSPTTNIGEGNHDDRQAFSSDFPSSETRWDPLLAE
mmetsp:Transcript_21859/g.51845  ORF Transcript_21859/g.51845 Transcript_21859/m.51845 type:complete len:223 (-) Transcript_21859:213-881(-)